MEKNGVTVSFVYTRSRCFLVHTRSKDSFLLIPGRDVFWFTPGHNVFLLTPGHNTIPLFIPGAARYSHQCPGCGGRFLGRYNAEERFLECLREWRLGERDPRLWGGSGQRVVSSRPVLGMSKTVGGRLVRLTAAASGGAGSISNLVSGQAVLGWGCPGPGLSPPAILSSHVGSVNDTLLLRWPAGDPEKESR